MKDSPGILLAEVLAMDDGVRGVNHRRLVQEGTRRRRAVIGVLTMLGVAALLAAPCGLAAQGAGRGEAPSKFSWRLTDSQVVEPGETVTTVEGTMTTGYTVEAQARGEGAAPIKNGRFRVTLNAFSPFQDRPGQEAGFWQVTGNWTLTDAEAPPEVSKTRYHPAVLRGTLRAKLGFNPATHPGPVKAQVEMATFRPGFGRQRGGGTFQGDELFTGKLTIDLQAPTFRRPTKGEMP